MAEATAEYLHRHIRRELGLSPNRENVIPGVTRPFRNWQIMSKVFHCCRLKQNWACSLTTAFQLVPEQSTAAIIVHHPQAKYYNIGETRVEQLMKVRELKWHTTSNFLDKLEIRPASDVLRWRHGHHVAHAWRVSFDQCFDELNLTNPALVAEIHREYIEAGSQIIQTNTFGANRYKLARAWSGRQGAGNQTRPRSNWPAGW